MPTYNAERYVARAIDSILAQTFADFEFIIVDDGSADRSLEIIRRYEGLDDRIRVLSRPNTGVVGAANDGLAMARGEVVARMDADDVSYPRRFERQVAFLDGHPDCVAVGARVRCIDSDGRPSNSDYLAPLTHAEIDARWHLLGVGGGIAHPTAMSRTAIVRRIGGYRELCPAEDVDLFLRLAEQGELANLPEVLLDYRVHFEGISQKGRARGELNSCIAAAAAHGRRGLRIPVELRRRHAIAAIEVGEGRAARFNACLTVAGRPFSRKSWRTLAASLFCGTTASRTATHPSACRSASFR
jgi:glycosyltransferase involved in cell wall biosynthesis